MQALAGLWDKFFNK